MIKRYQLVDAKVWRNGICTVFYASNAEDEVLRQKIILEAAMGLELQSIDIQVIGLHFPLTARPVFSSESSVQQWVATRKSRQRSAG